MPSFNWLQFLEKHAVPYTMDAGERNATCQCPMCGELDVEHHYMAISLQGKGYKCWRDQKHRGRSPIRLVQAIARCSYDEACDLVGQARPPLIPDRKLHSSVSSILGVKLPRRTQTPRGLSLPKEFKLINPKAVGVWNYLLKRGYTEEEIDWLSMSYQLRWARSGMWKYRVVVPILDATGDILCWTGRTILKEKEPRYLTLTTDEELARSKGYPAAITAPPKTLLGLQLLSSCDTPQALVVCEGPFDALKISVAGHRFGVWGTCLFGLNISKEQVELVCELASRFQKMYLLLDKDAVMRVFAVKQALASIRVASANLPTGVKDPGALTGKEAKQLCRSLV